MAIKEKIKPLTLEDLKVGQVYRGKRPKTIGIFEPLVDDRQIRYISEFRKAVKYIDHGFTPEFEEWCKKGLYKHTHSELDQLEFEKESDFKLSAKKIETVWEHMVQYDSPSVKHGKNYPTIPVSKFIKWAEKNVSDIMPKGEWASSL